jgi:hypothetical protein
MITYQDGQPVHVGDTVALCHRTYTGVVSNIIDSAADVDAWNTEESGLMIDTSVTGLTFFPKRSLTDDEVVFVSRHAAK